MARKIHLPAQHRSCKLSLHMHPEERHIEPVLDPLDFSIGRCCGEEVQQICHDAIRRGKAYERQRRLKYAIYGASFLLAGLVEALSFR